MRGVVRVRPLRYAGLAIRAHARGVSEVGEGTMALDSEEGVASLPNLPPGVAPAKPALDLWGGGRPAPPQPPPPAARGAGRRARGRPPWRPAGPPAHVSSQAGCRRSGV